MLKEANRGRLVDALVVHRHRYGQRIGDPADRYGFAAAVAQEIIWRSGELLLAPAVAVRRDRLLLGFDELAMGVDTKCRLG